MSLVFYTKHTNEKAHPQECPLYVTALLEHLRNNLELAYFNRFQKWYDDRDCDFGDPFGNSGNVRGFKNDVFEVHAYDWGWELQDNGEPQTLNFKCGNIEIEWYKYLGRGMWFREYVPTLEEMVEAYHRCMDSLDDGWNNKLDNEEKHDEQ